MLRGELWWMANAEEKERAVRDAGLEMFVYVLNLFLSRFAMLVHLARSRQRHWSPSVVARVDMRWLIEKYICAGRLVHLRAPSQEACV